MPLQPLERAGVLRVERLPAADHEFEIAAAVDIEGADADVVRLCLAVEDDALLPRGILIPNDLELIDHHDVELLVAVDVFEDHGVADLERRIDFLDLELRESGRRGRGVGHDGFVGTGGCAECRDCEKRRDEPNALSPHPNLQRLF